jgi:cytoskeletal protein RodZ
MRLMESPGKRLKAERESRNLSLRQVFESTKIREHLLKAIEEDQYELISSPVYVKGFLDAYSRYLGLDPDDVVRLYQKYLEHQALSKKPELEQRMTRSKLKQWIAFPKKRITLWLLIISVPVIILLVAITVYHGSLKPINHFLSSFEKKRSDPTSSRPSSPPTQREEVKDK